MLSAEVTVVVEFEAARSVVEAARPSGDWFSAVSGNIITSPTCFDNRGRPPPNERPSWMRLAVISERGADGTTGGGALVRARDKLSCTAGNNLIGARKNNSLTLSCWVSTDRTPKQNLSGVIIEVTTEQGAEGTSQKGGTRFEMRIAGAQVTQLIGTLSCNE